MIIHQMLPNFSYGDAIGDDTLALKRIFQAQGHTSEIFAGVIHPYLVREAFHWKYYRTRSASENSLVYHYSVGSEITNYLLEIPDKLVLIYHNVTPAHWFYGISPHMVELAVDGTRQLELLKDRVEVAWADSKYNASILADIGYGNVRILPIIFDFTRFNKAPNRVFQRQFKSERTTWLFVGRVTPNKCHEDIIRAFAVYKENLDPQARLIFVGDVKNCWRYADAMISMVRDLGVPDVTFTGMIDDDELIALYKMADLFVCMSEHEGFCVPLLEAMYFGLPIIAFDAGAVPETLGGAGILLRDKNPVLIAELADRLRVDKDFKQAVVQRQKAHLTAVIETDYSDMVKDLVAELA